MRLSRPPTRREERWPIWAFSREDRPATTAGGTTSKSTRLQTAAMASVVAMQALVAAPVRVRVASRRAQVRKRRLRPARVRVSDVHAQRASRAERSLVPARPRRAWRCQLALRAAECSSRLPMRRTASRHWGDTHPQRSAQAAPLKAVARRPVARAAKVSTVMAARCESARGRRAPAKLQPEIH